MLIPSFQKQLAFLVLLFIASTSYGVVYKWVDDNGEVNYTQLDPLVVPAEKIDPPPPPAIDPETAKKEIDILIEKQNGTYEANEKERQRIAAEAAEKKKKEEYCRVNKQNLQLYQNNPGDKVVDSKGNVTRLTEEVRQQQIAEIKKNIAEHCQ